MIQYQQFPDDGARCGLKQANKACMHNVGANECEVETRHSKYSTPVCWQSVQKLFGVDASLPPTLSETQPHRLYQISGNLQPGCTPEPEIVNM